VSPRTPLSATSDRGDLVLIDVDNPSRFAGSLHLHGQSGVAHRGDQFRYLRDYALRKAAQPVSQLGSLPVHEARPAHSELPASRFG
jgi:hypothetical protein